VKVVGRSDSVLNEDDPKGGSTYPPGGDTQALAMASTHDPSIGECQKADLDTGVGADARSLDL
jgi:hypothetical protein